MDNKKKVIINLIKSFFVTYAWMNIGGLESTNILLLCVFFVAYLLLAYKDRIVGDIQKSVNIAGTILGIIFTCCYVLYSDLSGGLESRLFVFIYTAFSAIGLYVMFYELLTIVISKINDFTGKKKQIIPHDFSWKVLLVAALVVFVCCMPMLVLNYPGILTTDSLNQLAQARGLEGLVDHHPWMHTLLIGLMYKIGYAVTGDLHAAIAFYTVFQIIIVSFSVGYAVECFYEMGIGKKAGTALLGCFVLLPYNLYYSVTMWKDIIFSMAVLVLTVTLMRIIEKVTLRDSIIFVISAFVMCMFRHNGFYAYIGTVVILFVFKRKEIKKYIFPATAVLILAILFRGPVQNACDVAPGEKVFNFNIPLQQVGRVIAEEKQITDEQRSWLENINSLNYIKAGYARDCTDNMTAWVIDGNQEYFDSHNGEFIRLWIELGLKNPKEYFEAFVDITKGYWAPMKPQQTVYEGVTANDQGVESRPLIKGPVQIKINELLYKLYTMLPVYGFFYCMGGFLWILLIEGAVYIVNKDYQKLVIFMPVLMLTLTLFVATPMVADLRYSYALLLVIPYTTAFLMKGKES